MRYSCSHAEADHSADNDIDVHFWPIAAVDPASSGRRLRSPLRSSPDYCAISSSRLRHIAVINCSGSVHKSYGLDSLENFLVNSNGPFFQAVSLEM
jgi:hypothetical protein